MNQQELMPLAEHPIVIAIKDILKLIEQTNVYKRSDNEVQIHRRLMAVLRAHGVQR